MDEQYTVEAESTYTPFSDMQARNYFGATCGFSRAISDYNTDAMRVPVAQPVRTAESKFMAGQVGIPAYVLNYQCGVGGDGVDNGLWAGVPYGPSVDKSIIDRVALGGDPRDYGYARGNPGAALSINPAGLTANDVAYGTREYYPRAGVIDSHSPMPGRVPNQPMQPASQNGKTQWPWPVAGIPLGTPKEGCIGMRDGNLTITLDPNTIMLFMFIVIVTLCYLGMGMLRRMEKMSAMLGNRREPGDGPMMAAEVAMETIPLAI